MNKPPPNQTTEPSGNTQTQVTLFGTNHPLNGQPSVKGVGATSDGSMKVEIATGKGYLNGAFTIQAGDVIYLAEGRVIAITRNGGNVPPSPRPPRPF